MHEGRPAERLGVRSGDGPRFELWVCVEDVDETVAQLREADVPVLAEPEEMPWDERMAQVGDPDGNPVVVGAPPPAG